ncbi:MAG: carboxypeptidase regulatory-like domain-containing protein, partial [Nitrospirota bacterium]|nr:carboxypeptidase regulatory-like domain-containing protein [Nitrospirota bacterium]
MFKTKRLLAVIVMFLFVVILGSCGSGGKSSNKGRDDGGIADGNSTSEIKSYETYTESNGIATFTLPDGSVKTLQVVDEQSGDPILGILVTLTFDEKRGFFFISGDDDHTFSIISTNIPNKVVSANISGSQSAKNTSIRAEANEEMPKAFLSRWGQVLIRDDGEDKDNEIPVAQDKVESRLWQYFLDNNVTYKATIKVEDLFHFGELLKSTLKLSDDYLGIIMTTGKASLSATVGVMLSTADVAYQVGKYAKEKYYKDLGYDGNSEVALFSCPERCGHGLYYIIVPKDELPNPLRNASINGRVVDKDTGRPLPGVEVSLVPNPGVGVIWTDADGYYRFLNNIPVPGDTADYQLTVKSLQYEAATSGKITIAASEVWVQDFTLTPYDSFAQFRNLGITVKDAFSGKPLEGVFVSSYDTDTNRYDDSQTTLSNGLCSLNLKEGGHDLTVYKDGYVINEINNVSTFADRDSILEVSIQRILANQAPEIDSLTTNPSSNPLSFETGVSISLFCYATDPDNNNLTFSWDKTGGNIPGSGPIVTWTAPSTAGTYTITCNVSDGKGGTDSKSVDIKVSEQTELLTITPTSLSPGTVGISYTATNLSATGGKAPYSWSILSGNLPPGLTMSTGGIISGTSTTAGTYTFTAKVTDSSSPQQEAQKTFIIVVNPPVTIPPTPTNTSPGTTSSPGPITSSSTVSLSWSAVNGATYYSLGVRDIATGVLIVDTSVSGSSYSASLEAGRQYRWNVAACNSAGCSTYTTPLYFQTPGTTVTIPATPTNTFPGITSSPGPVTSSSTVSLSWSAVSGATSYGVGVRDIASGVLVVSTSVSGSSYSASLDTGRQYRWNVAA